MTQEKEAAAARGVAKRKAAREAIELMREAKRGDKQRRVFGGGHVKVVVR